MHLTSRQDLAQALEMFLQGGVQGEIGARSLFDELWPKFVRDFKRAGLAHGVAEEVASDAFLKVLTAGRDLRDPVAMEAWAKRIARNTLFSHFRDTRQTSLHEVQASDEEWAVIHKLTADPVTGDPSTLLCMNGQIEKFCSDHPDRSWTLEQCAVHSWTLEELSLELGRTLAATKEYLSQCRKHLRRYLQPCLD